VPVCRLNLVVLCSQVAARRDEVDVVVGVVVLFELDWCELEPGQFARRWDGCDNPLELLLIIEDRLLRFLQPVSTVISLWHYTCPER
jgi:hypothetical protein